MILTKGGATILTYEKKEQPSPAKLKTLIARSLDADKALDIITIDLHENAAIADYMIIASGTSSRHISAMAEKLKDRLALLGVKNIRLEGVAQSDWVVIDAGDIIIHLFRPEVRSFYNMEKMWCEFRPHNLVSGQIPA